MVAGILLFSMHLCRTGLTVFCPVGTGEKWLATDNTSLHTSSV